MGHSESFENDTNLAPEIQKEKGADLSDQAVIEVQESIRQELREAQEQSDDESFKKINVDILKPASLMVLNELVKLDDPFPKKLLMKEEIRAAQESPFYADQRTYENPKERQEYLDEFLELHANDLKDIIAADPNSYYTEDLMPSDTTKQRGQESQPDLNK